MDEIAHNVFVSGHPLVQHKLALLRAAGTPPPVFRALVRDLSRLLFVEAAGDLATESATVRTPLGECPARVVGERVGLFPVLRAGLGMADAILDLVPDARVWHLGLYRDHETLRPVTYYQKLPAEPACDVAFVLDPMLATGGSAVESVGILKRWGVRRVKFVGIIAAPEGVRALREAHPDVPMHLAAVDSHLNEHAYIVPGLGDAGDRQFGTA
jgi:uracil phosphoribosyltransferase